MNNFRLIFIFFMFSTLLTACGSTSPTENSNVADNANSCQLKKVSKITRFIAKPLDLFKFSSDLQIPETAPAPFHAKGKSNLLYAPLAQSYIKKIAERLIKASTMPLKQPPAYYVNSERYFNGLAFFDYGVVLTMGMLDGSSEDDEIAFIVAHELAHLILGHVENEKSLKKSVDQLALVQKGTHYLSNLSGMAIQLAPEGDSNDAAERISHHNQKVETLVNRLKDVLEQVAKPAWGAQQEDEADLLAIELMYKAGYAPRGAQQALKSLEDGANDACLELTALNDTLDNVREFAEEFDWTDVAEYSQEDIGSFKGAFTQLKKKTQEETLKALMAAALPSSHRPIHERWERVSKRYKELVDTKGRPTNRLRTKELQQLKAKQSYQEYVDTVKAIDAFKVAMLDSEIDIAKANIDKIRMTSSQGRLLKRQLRLAQGRTEDAVANLQLAMKLNNPALKVFELYSEAQLAEGREEALRAAVSRGAKQFDDKYHFLPEEIYLYATSEKKDSDTEDLLSKCRLVARQDLWDICEAASIGSSPEFRQYPQQIIEEECLRTNCKKNKSIFPWPTSWTSSDR